HSRDALGLAADDRLGVLLCAGDHRGDVAGRGAHLLRVVVLRLRSHGLVVGLPVVGLTRVDLGLALRFFVGFAPVCGLALGLGLGLFLGGGHRLLLLLVLT